MVCNIFLSLQYHVTGGIYLKRKTLRKRSLLRIIALLIILSVLAVLFVQWRVRPVIASIASVQAKSFAVTAVNKAAAKALEECDIHQLEEIDTSEDGSLRSLSTNTAKANDLKHLITLKAQEAIGKLKHEKIDIPSGLIFGGDLFGAVGPAIPVYISLSGNVDSDFEEEFESGGINQTVHKLSLRINVQLSVLTPSGTLSENVTTSVLIGETVIIGSTPQGMFSCSQN